MLRLRRFASSGLWCLLVGHALAGCSARRPGADEGAAVSGKVLFRKAPLPGGTLVFVVEAGGQTYRGSAVIEADGSYRVTTVRPGSAKIAVETETLRPPDEPNPNVPPPPKGQTPRTYVPIPCQYADWRGSGLTFEIKPGSQTHDIVLE
jgi:hypothetical protein